MECVPGVLSKGKSGSQKLMQDLGLDEQKPQCLFLPQVPKLILVLSFKPKSCSLPPPQDRRLLQTLSE